jgi:hypothetical protein
MLNDTGHRSRFRVVIPYRELVRGIGCPHQEQQYPLTCRSCSVSEEVVQAIEAGSISDYWIEDAPHLDARVLSGVVLDDRGRRALTRLLAITQRHPEPSTLDTRPRV